MRRKPNVEEPRRDLCDGAIDRVVQFGMADFRAAMNEAKAAQGDKAESSPASGRCPQLSQLAEQAMRTAVEPERSRARARFELLMVAARDRELSLVFQGLMDQFGAISEEAVAQLQPEDRPPDRELIREQASAVVTFLGGFLFQLANGLARRDNAKQLEGYLHAVIAGVAAEHPRIRRAGRPG
jgi:hypothetical protein